MTSQELREKFLSFFERQGHVIVPSSSLLPEDASVLLTTAGMQQFKPYYTGDADPLETMHASLGRPLGSKNAVSIQKSFRTSDIDEVGDESHLTFFEMLGNFSFGGYFKEEAIRLAYEFITKELGLLISYVTVFEGSAVVPKDEESKKIWKGLDPNIEIREEGMDDVFWGPTGSSGPCGPTTEIYCKNKNGKDIEVWNIVFNQFFYAGSREELLSGASGKKLELLQTAGVDTGMGLERLAMIAQNKETIFETDLFSFIISALPGTMPENVKRIFADHVRASCFLITDGVRPSNKGAGYILRRLMRRAIVYEQYGISVKSFFELFVERYGNFYKELSVSVIAPVFQEEYEKFIKTLEAGLSELEKMDEVDSVSAFKLYQSFGLPYETIKEIGKEKTKNLTRDMFDEEFEKHQEVSRAGLEKKFGGHGMILDTGELKAGDEAELDKITRLHTATHLLNQALHEVLGEEVVQAGSDITSERTRFDFTYQRKITKEELEKIEGIVNKKISEDLPVIMKEMKKSDALRMGARAFRLEKYPEISKIYFIGDPDKGEVYSKEFCGGPHVAHTGAIGHFKITKEESSSAGVRRIRAIVEP